MATWAGILSRKLMSKQTAAYVSLGAYTYIVWHVFYNYQHHITIDNCRHMKVMSQEYALNKLNMVEDYNRFNERYQNWKGETKKDIVAWKDRQLISMMSGESAESVKGSGK